ncbi:MAG: response regulator transcription factor [Deltaproteobacteria bacterium]|nr:response regulator transcription factor [Deltaproteobacteria bacterium]
MTAPKVLVVEDEAHLAAGLKLNFELEGFEVLVAGTVRDASRLLLQPGGFAVIVLDVMLPDADGVSFCRKIREAGDFTPVIMLTVKSSAEDRVLGLESGADDYVGKPFEFGELLARVQSVRRRQRWDQDHQGNGVASHRLELGHSVVDFDTHEVWVDGELTSLTRLEIDLLRYFAANPARVISRAELLEQVWRFENAPDSRSVDNFIGRLRKHFEDDPAKPAYFVSVRGVGYQFFPDPERRR